MLTRAEVAARLGVSHATVRRLEQAQRLNPRIDERGVHWFEEDEVGCLADERERGASFHEPEMLWAETADRSSDDPKQRRHEIERQELELREADIAHRKLEHERRARRELERLHAEKCGEARGMLIDMWRERRLRDLRLMPASELRFLLALLIPMTQEELDAIPWYQLPKRIESELRRADR